MAASLMVTLLLIAIAAGRDKAVSMAIAGVDPTFAGTITDVRCHLVAVCIQKNQFRSKRRIAPSSCRSRAILYLPNAPAYLTLAAGFFDDHADYVSSDDSEEVGDVGFRGRSASVGDDFVATDDELIDGSHPPSEEGDVSVPPTPTASTSKLTRTGLYPHLFPTMGSLAGAEKPRAGGCLVLDSSRSRPPS